MQPFLKLIFGLVITLASFLIFPPALAQFGIEEAGNNAGLSSPVSSPSVLITNIINIFLSLVGLISIAAIVYGAFSYVVSLGDDQKVAKAKKVILYAIVGLLIALAAGTIVSFIFTQLNIG